MSDAPTPSLFEQQHARLDAQLHAHLLDVVGSDFGAALERLVDWHQATLAHIRVEEQHLLPHIPTGARWAERVYRVEHERIALLADEYLARVQAVALAPPGTDAARREAVLALLDAAHALRHVLEHHHEREHKGLALEIPLALQEAVWGAAGGGAA